VQHKMRFGRYRAVSLAGCGFAALFAVSQLQALAAYRRESYKSSACRGEAFGRSVCVSNERFVPGCFTPKPAYSERLPYISEQQSTVTSAPKTQETPEPFRLRVNNAQYGPVEISTDRGAHWFLVARVVRPATQTAPGAQSKLPEVQRSSDEGLAFGVGAGLVVRILPDNPLNRKDKAAMLLNVPKTFALFKDFIPPVGSPVQQVLTGNAAVPIPNGYSPADADTILFTAQRTLLPSDKIDGYAKDAADVYREMVLSRLRAKGKKPLSGVLEITGRLAQGEEPKAVTFIVDGVMKAITNSPPFTLKCDTKDWANGEHLIEIRALDAGGAVLTKARQLVYVQNPPT
jgi:hypothetical protein